MIEVIQSVLRRLQDELHDVEVDDSDYEPSSDDESDGPDGPDAKAEVDVQPSTTRVVFKKREDAGDCAICLEPMRFRQHGLKLVCGHRFHSKCVTAWLAQDTRRRCPTCRTPSVEAAERGEETRRSARLVVVDDQRE